MATKSGGIRMRVQARGTAELARAMRGRKKEVIEAIDRDVEVVTLEAINEARANAPFKTGELKRGIQLITQKSKPMTRAWGGFRVYTRRQEYEHRAKKGFMRRAQWNARKALREKIQATLNRLGGRV